MVEKFRRLLYYSPSDADAVVNLLLGKTIEHHNTIPMLLSKKSSQTLYYRKPSEDDTPSLLLRRQRSKQLTACELTLCGSRQLHLEGFFKIQTTPVALINLTQLNTFRSSLLQISFFWLPADMT